MTKQQREEIQLHIKHMGLTEGEKWLENALLTLLAVLFIALFYYQIDRYAIRQYDDGVSAGIEIANGAQN